MRRREVLSSHCLGKKKKKNKINRRKNPPIKQTPKHNQQSSGNECMGCGGCAGRGMEGTEC